MICVQPMKKIYFLINTLLWISLFFPPLVQAAQPETPEIIFNGSEAKPLKDKAYELGNAVAIYEYVRNNFEFAPYHGSRSGSVNTFLGRRGNDVDIATALIAMMRSQNIPARYSVATVRLPYAKLKNWLDTDNIDVAVQMLKDQGIQNVKVDSTNKKVDFEHAWAEVLVPFEQYRGLPTASSVDCSLSAQASRCSWIPLDGSFKQRSYNGLSIDPYTSITFDYTAYYAAIKNKDVIRLDKNPLTILEEQIVAWLRTSNPGKTLEDVADAGQIIEIHDGLLPASLPYTLVNAVRHYDSIADHDVVAKSSPTTEPKKWGKSLSISIYMVAPIDGGGTLTSNFGAGNALLATLNTRRLTLTTEFPPPGNIPNMVTRLGGLEIARPLSGNGIISGYTPRIGDRYTITVTMDGAPDPSSGVNDRNITATYSGIIGGYYLIATGGESSNWSQVHRAADQLLTDNGNYKVVFNANDTGSNGQPCDQSSGLNCTPYVDSNNNGWDVSDQMLLENKPALDALTGGLLYVAATQYYAKQREQFDRADHLMKTKTPIIGFLGVVSSVYEAEYIDGTAFSILPGGLLIDMKGITISGSYRANESPIAYSNSQFELLGHISSSLEHEIWQELTGYDAVSTVRGIQMALAGGSSLINVKRDATTNTLPTFLTSVGFGANAPSDFTRMNRDIFTTKPNSWSHATTTALIGFDVIKKTPTGIDDTRLGLLSYYNDYWNLNLKCFDDTENTLNNLKTSYGGSVTLQAGNSCGVSWAEGTSIDDVITLLSNGYDLYRGGGNAVFFNYLDAAQGFVSTDFAYRSKTLSANAYPTGSIVGIHNDLSIQNTSQSWVEYLLPSRLIAGPNNYFEVDIRKQYATPTGRLTSMSFEILNRGGK